MSWTKDRPLSLRQLISQISSPLTDKERFMSEEKVVTYELEGEIALIGLNRPDKRNALSPDLMKELRDAAVRAGDEARCGIIFGHGGNFCAGLDLAWAAENWKDGRAQRLPFQFNRNSYQEVIARGNIPFIAALHGATLGGGLETAACAHIRVADETTFFGLPEGKRGIYIGGGGSVRGPDYWASPACRT
jgi:(methylthio)acryloyl-CoA hydratase